MLNQSMPQLAASPSEVLRAEKVVFLKYSDVHLYQKNGEAEY